MVQKKLHIKKKRDARTYASFWHTSWCLLEKGKQDKEGSFHQFLASLVFTAFTFEAYLNHIGATIFKSWHKVERSLGLMPKLALICEQLDICPDYDRSPWLILTSILKFRNTIAHGKTEALQEEKVVTADDKYEDYLYAWLPTEWEKFATQKNAEKAREDVQKIITLIHEHAKLSKGLDSPFMDGSQSGSATLIET